MPRYHVPGTWHQVHDQMMTKYNQILTQYNKKHPSTCETFPGQQRQTTPGVRGHWVWGGVGRCDWYTPQPDGTLHNQTAHSTTTGCARTRARAPNQQGPVLNNRIVAGAATTSTEQNEILEPSGCGVSRPMEGALEHGPH